MARTIRPPVEDEDPIKRHKREFDAEEYLKCLYVDPIGFTSTE